MASRTNHELGLGSKTDGTGTGIRDRATEEHWQVRQQQAAKARGARLGNPNGAAGLLEGWRAAAGASALVRRAKAAQHAAAVAPLLEELCGAGLRCREVAVQLNQRGVPSPSGGSWYAEQVRRAAQALEALV